MQIKPLTNGTADPEFQRFGRHSCALGLLPCASLPRGGGRCNETIAEASARRGCWVCIGVWSKWCMHSPLRGRCDSTGERCTGAAAGCAGALGHLSFSMAVDPEVAESQGRIAWVPDGCNMILYDKDRRIAICGCVAKVVASS